MIAANFDVGRRSSGRSAAEQNVLSGSLKEIVDDFEGAARTVAAAAAKDLRIGARPSSCNADKIGKERIHDGDVRHCGQVNRTRGFILRRAMHPDSVKYHVIYGTIFAANSKSRDQQRSGTCNLETNKAVVVGAGFK